MSQVDRLLGGPGLARLVDALARRIERGRPLSGLIEVTDAAPDEREAIAALFGRRPGTGSAARVDLDRLDAIVRTSGAAESLAVAVEQLRGPVVVRADRAEAERRAWASALEPLHRLARDRAEYGAWVESVIARGAVRRLARAPDAAAVLCGRVASVLAELPAHEESLQRLAGRVLGSAHALDAGTPESSLVLSALNSGVALDGGGRQRRELWASAGVALDELSSTVLVHRLPLPGPLGQLTSAGEPVVITLRQLRTLDVPPLGRSVFVCENPTVVDAAARELGRAGAPLVCLQGQPSLAADVLLDRLARDGLRYHGDFDWGGVRIANRLHERFGFDPWRYRAADLESSAAVPGSALAGAPVDANWDRDLRPALTRRGMRLEEEQVLEGLLGDLADH